MALRDTVETDILAAMKSGDSDARDILKLVKGRIEGIAKKTSDEIKATGPSHPATDDEVLAIMRKFREDSDSTAALMEHRGGQDAEVARLRRQSAVLTRYLPAEVTQADMEEAVGRVIAENGFEGMQDMGRAVGLVKAEFGVMADGKAIAEMVQAALAG